MECFNVSSLEKTVGLKICQLCAVDFTLKHFLTPLIDQMQKKGWNVTSVCSDSGFVKEMHKKGYNIKVINISRSFNIFKHLKTFFELLKFFRKEKFDILHVHTPVAGLIGRIAAKFSGIPFVIYTAHGFYFHDEMPVWKKYFFLKLEKVGGYFTDLLFTQSKEDEISAIKNKILTSKKIFTIGNGVNVEKFNPEKYKNKSIIKKELNIPEKSFVIGIIGRLVKEKGYIEFLEMAIKLKNKYKNIYFLVIGERIKSDHNEEIEFYFQKAKKNLGVSLIRLGYREDIPKLINIMDIFCLPSYREGMPRVIIEAMMMGKPVVATNIRGSREEVIDGITGFLVPTKDSLSLYNAIKKLILNEKYILELGKQGRVRARMFFSETRVITKQLNLIERNFLLKIKSSLKNKKK